MRTIELTYGDHSGNLIYGVSLVRVNKIYSYVGLYIRSNYYC